MPLTEEKAVVAGIDGSSSAARAALWAAAEASRRDTSLLLVHVYAVPYVSMPGLVGSIGQIRNGMAAQGRDWLESAKTAVLERFPRLTVETAVQEGNSVAELTHRSRTAHMLVLGSRGLGGFTGLIIGSTAVSLAAHGYCPIVVVRGRTPVDSPPVEGAVVVGIDGSPNSEQALALAFEEAALRGVPLIAVHAWSDVTYNDVYGVTRLPVQWDTIEEGERRLLAERLAGWQAKYPDVEVRRELVRDRPRHALLDRSKEAQLVVVGSRGRGGFRGMLLGSTSRALVQHAQCPVLVVRPGTEA